MAETQDKPTSSLFQRVYSKSCEVAEDAAEYVASWPLGQAVLRQTDRFLWTVEKCAEWSVPNTTPPPNPNHSKQPDSNGTFGKPAPLIRPLPWLIFLPMLLVLRITRFCVNLGAVLMGVEPVKPTGVVRFLQVRRRRIRALKFLGLRRIRQRKLCKQQTAEAPKISWKTSLYNTMSRVMCFSNSYSEVSEAITVEDVHPSSVAPSCNTDLKRKYIEVLKHDYLDWEDVDDDEELMKKIDKLVDDDNDNEEDPDFLPAEDSHSEEDSISDPEDDTAPASVQPLHRPSSHSSLTNEIIEEENEDSDSTTVSANSDDESSQQIITSDGNGIPTTPNHQTPNTPPTVSKNKLDANSNPNYLDAGVTSDEYYSPLNSISTSPEPPKDSQTQDGVSPKNMIIAEQASPTKFDHKQISEEFINSEQHQVTVTVTNGPNSTNHKSPSDDANASQGARANHNSARGHGKKQKHRRRISSFLRRKRK